ncbi:hypothetical protein [Absidia glauca]|uniref:CipC-like antibiotic response protein n=1 Tax=Absidia glauca TaxID=4829 RepID=A0A168MBV1_ABSGL|nr:hypothetical protein [Absidia glauca]
MFHKREIKFPLRTSFYFETPTKGFSKVAGRSKSQSKSAHEYPPDSVFRKRAFFRKDEERMEEGKGSKEDKRRGLPDFFGKQHEEVHNTSEEHKAKLSHELIAGAAAYEASKAYNEHCEKNGKPVNHAQAKQLLAGLVGGAVDRLIETKGLDFVDKQKAKRHAEEHIDTYYTEGSY